MESREKDNLFTQTVAPEKFEFNESVAQVFDNMLSRSVPLYRECQQMVVDWCVRFAREGTNVYDLGCSTGALLFQLAERLSDISRLRLIGVDSSGPMLKKARKKLAAAARPCELVETDLDIGFRMTNASAIVMNYTLQFIPPDRRGVMAQKISNGLIPGGCFILTEKINSESPHVDDSFVEFHHEFKLERGYSELEIAQKREALESVLTPLTVEENIALLKEAGFRSVDLFFKWNNFAGFVALK